MPGPIDAPIAWPPATFGTEPPRPLMHFPLVFRPVEVSASAAEDDIWPPGTKPDSPEQRGMLAAEYITSSDEEGMTLFYRPLGPASDPQSAPFYTQFEAQRRPIGRPRLDLP